LNFYAEILEKNTKQDYSCRIFLSMIKQAEGLKIVTKQKHDSCSISSTANLKKKKKKKNIYIYKIKKAILSTLNRYNTY